MAKFSTAMLDALDRQIVSLLQQQGRLTFAELGRQIHLSLPAVAERVRKLEERGVILGYHARISYEQMGFPLQVFLLVTASRENCPRVVAVARALPEVQEGYRVTGTASHILKVYAASVDHLEELIDHFLAVGEVVTSMVLSVPISKSAFEPPASAPALPDSP